MIWLTWIDFIKGCKERGIIRYYTIVLYLIPNEDEKDEKFILEKLLILFFIFFKGDYIQ